MLVQPFADDVDPFPATLIICSFFLKMRKLKDSFGSKVTFATSLFFSSELTLTIMLAEHFLVSTGVLRQLVTI